MMFALEFFFGGGTWGGGKQKRSLFGGNQNQKVVENTSTPAPQLSSAPEIREVLVQLGPESSDARLAWPSELDTN